MLNWIPKVIFSPHQNSTQATLHSRCLRVNSFCQLLTIERIHTKEEKTKNGLIKIAFPYPIKFDLDCFSNGLHEKPTTKTKTKKTPGSSKVSSTTTQNKPKTKNHTKNPNNQNTPQHTLHTPKKLQNNTKNQLDTTILSHPKTSKKPKNNPKPKTNQKTQTLNHQTPMHPPKRYIILEQTAQILPRQTLNQEH